MKIENEKLERYTLWFAIAGIVIFVITAILFLTTGDTKFGCDKIIDTTAFNDFGSFLSGSAGLLFTIATTILVYMTYKTQKEELKEAREEAEASRKALELQARTTQLQQFENTFFNLLGNHREVLKSLQETWKIDRPERSGQKIVEGKMLIDIIADYIKTLIRGLENSNYAIINKTIDLEYDGYIPKSQKESIEKEFIFEKISQESRKCKSKFANSEDLPILYEKIFSTNRSSLGHYFRNLFHLIKFVDEYSGFDNLSKEEIHDFKYKYIRLVRAQLSNNELILLALNSISEFGEEFIPYIDKYKLLKNTNIFEELNEMDGLIEKYPHFT